MSPEVMLAWALFCLLRYKGDLFRAARDMRARPPGALPRNLPQYLHRVWRRWQRGDIRLPTRATPQRKKNISDEEAKQAAIAFGEGYGEKWGDLAFSSVQEVRWNVMPPRRAISSRAHRLPLQACEQHPFLKQLVQESDVSPKHIWRRATAVDPSLRVAHFLFRAKLVPRVREQRVTIAKELLSMPADTWLYTIYLDETWFKLRHTPSGRALTREKGPVVYEIDIPPGYDLPAEEQGTIFLFLAVHPLLGRIHHELLSPTTGHPRHGHYKVSYIGLE
jgi:hypothetical protein